MVRIKPGLRLWLCALAAAASLSVSACGDSGTGTVSTVPLTGGQVFMDTGASFTPLAGITVEHRMGGVIVETTITDEYGRFGFQPAMVFQPGMMMNNSCAIRIMDDTLSIDATYGVDMTGRTQVSVYGMVYSDSAGQNYAWAHEFTGRWNEMPGNFDGTMDADDIQNFWDEGSHSWLESFGGRIMYTM